MRYRCFAWLLLVVVGGVWLICLPSSVSAEGGQRTRSCPPGTPRDPQGYCVLPAAPSKSQTTKAKTSHRAKRSSKSRTPAATKSTQSSQRSTRPNDETQGHDVSTPQSSTDSTSLGSPTESPSQEPAQRSTEPPHEEPLPSHDCFDGEEWSDIEERCVQPPSIADATSSSTSESIAEETDETVETDDMTSQRNPLLFPWLTFGAGLAVSLTGMILAATAYADYQGVERFSSMAELDDWAASMEGKALAGDILLGLGLAATVAGVVWLVLARRNRDSTDRARRRVTIGASPGSEGRFTLHIQGAY